MRVPIFLLMLVASSGTCRGEDDPSPAKAAYVSCLFKNAHQLDDHTSDAATIAKAIAAACLTEEAAVEEEIGAGMNPQARAFLHQNFINGREGIAIHVVLEARKPNSN